MAEKRFRALYKNLAVSDWAVAAFDVVFGHRGRLYFRNSSRRLEVLAIGTKNTQNRDLEFLARV